MRGTRILFCPMVEGVGLGPLTKLLAVAEELVLRGGSCAFLVSQDHATLVEELGYKSFIAPRPSRKDLNAPDFRLSDAARALGILDLSYLDAAIGAEIDAIDQFKASALMSATKLTAVASAKVRGLPLVSIATTPDGPDFESPMYDLTQVPEACPPEIRTFMKKFGVTIDHDLAELSFMMSDLKVAASFHAFDPDLPSEGLLYAGSLTSKGIDLYGPQVLISDCELVTVYINRGTALPRSYLPIIGGLAATARECQFVVIEQANFGALTLPANVVVVPRAPIGRLLARSSLFISGGGKNAIMAALTAAVPVIGIRGRSAERDFNLRKVEELGAGLTIPNPLDQSGASKVFEEVRRNARYATTAWSLSRVLRQLPGPAGVADLLIELPA